MFIFRKVTGDVYGCKFLFYTLYNLHKFQIAAQNYLSDYRCAHVAARVYYNIGYHRYVVHLHSQTQSHLLS